MKFIIICTLVLAGVALLQTVSAQSHNHEWGVQEPGDKLLHREIVVEKYKFMQVKI